MNRQRCRFTFDNRVLGDALAACLGGLSIEDFLAANSTDLALKQGTTVQTIEDWKTEVRERCGIISSSDSGLFLPLFPRARTLTSLDLILMHVLREQHITEIAGESGTGKTRLLLYIVSVVLLTTNYSVALILTTVEDGLSIVVETLVSLSSLLTVPQLDTAAVLKRLYFLRETSPTDLLQLFDEGGQVWELCKSCPTLKMICVDSIGLLRIIYGKTSNSEARLNNPGYTVGQNLLSMARLKNLAVMMTNHVGDYITTPQLMTSAQQHAQRGQFSGQSVPNRLPRLPVNLLPSQGLCVYKPEIPECQDAESWLVQGDVDDSAPGMLTDDMLAPKINLPLPTFSYINYRSNRTFYRDVVTSLNNLVTPSLGISWASHLSTRIVISRTQKESVLHVLWSEFMPACSMVLPSIPHDLIKAAKTGG